MSNLHKDFIANICMLILQYLLLFLPWGCHRALGSIKYSWNLHEEGHKGFITELFPFITQLLHPRDLFPLWRTAGKSRLQATISLTFLGTHRSQIRRATSHALFVRATTLHGKLNFLASVRCSGSRYAVCNHFSFLRNSNRCHGNISCFCFVGYFLYYLPLLLIEISVKY